MWNGSTVSNYHKREINSKRNTKHHCNSSALWRTITYSTIFANLYKAQSAAAVQRESVVTARTRFLPKILALHLPRAVEMLRGSGDRTSGSRIRALQSCQLASRPTPSLVLLKSNGTLIASKAFRNVICQSVIIFLVLIIFFHRWLCNCNSKFAAFTLWRVDSGLHQQPGIKPKPAENQPKTFPNCIMKHARLEDNLPIRAFCIFKFARFSW